MTTRQAKNGKPDTVEKADPVVPSFGEVGKITAGMGRSLYDEFLPALRGRKGLEILRDMSVNDATIGGLLFGIEMFIRELDWRGKPDDPDNPDDVEAAEFLDEAMGDMSHTWADFIAEVLKMLPFGWSYFEIVYKQRHGRTGEHKSQYDDQKVGWRKFAFRSQDTLWKWEVDEHGGVAGMWQQVEGGKVFLPIEICLHFKTTTAPGNPNGISILRRAYRAWHFKRRIEEIEAVGVERRLAGLPMAEVPVDVLNASDPRHATFKNLVTRVKRDQQQGFLFPLEYDANGNPLYKFSLLSGGDARGSTDTRAIISGYKTEMLMSVLADWIGLGHDAVGSRALADPKIDAFRTALGAWADAIQEIINRHAVDRLFHEMNTTIKGNASIVHSPVDDMDLSALADIVFKTYQAGMDWFDGEEGGAASNRIREMAGFDPVEPSEIRETAGQRTRRDPASGLEIPVA